MNERRKLLEQHAEAEVQRADAAAIAAEAAALVLEPLLTELEAQKAESARAAAASASHATYDALMHRRAAILVKRGLPNEAVLLLLTEGK
jgi:hypothetical protein